MIVEPEPSHQSYYGPDGANIVGLVYMVRSVNKASITIDTFGGIDRGDVVFVRRDVKRPIYAADGGAIPKRTRPSQEMGGALAREMDTD